MDGTCPRCGKPMKTVVVGSTHARKGGYRQGEVAIQSVKTSSNPDCSTNDSGLAPLAVS